MHHADLTDYEFVMRLFNQHLSLFPHIRRDKIKERLERRQVILESGIVIVYHRVKRLTHMGDVEARKGDCVLDQIVSKHREMVQLLPSSTGFFHG